MWTFFRKECKFWSIFFLSHRQIIYENNRHNEGVDQRKIILRSEILHYCGIYFVEITPGHKILLLIQSPDLQYVSAILFHKLYSARGSTENCWLWGSIDWPLRVAKTAVPLPLHLNSVRYIHSLCIDPLYIYTYFLCVCIVIFVAVGQQLDAANKPSYYLFWTHNL